MTWRLAKHSPTMLGINKGSYKLFVAGLNFYNRSTLKGTFNMKKEKIKVFKGTKKKKNSLQFSKISIAHRS